MCIREGSNSGDTGKGLRAAKPTWLDHGTCSYTATATEVPEEQQLQVASVIPHYSSLMAVDGNSLPVSVAKA